MSEQIVYLDTTILIASFIHSPKVKFEIRDKIKSFKNVLTGQIAQQEFTRRLLKEAEYLLGLLKKQKNRRGCPASSTFAQLSSQPKVSDLPSDANDDRGGSE